jgi:hypothetical protein
MTTSRKLFGLTSLLILLLLVQVGTVLSQNNRVENFIKAGPADAETLTRAYLEPYPTGIGGALNTGWFQSASTHKLFGFDLQIRGGLAIVPTSDRAFNVENLNLEKVELAIGEPSISPTGAGTDSKGPLIRLQDETGAFEWFNLPQGSGFNYIPAPLIQGSVGLIKNTDLTVRFIPEIQMGDYIDFNMRGIGIKHSISQWLPETMQIPVEISVFAGINHVDITGHFDMDPPQPDPTTNYDNQRVYIDFNTFAAKILVGKDFNFISLYGAIGYESSTMDLAVTGNYPVPTRGPNGEVITEPLTDPFAYSQNGKNKYSATGGVSFKLSLIRIFGEFTLAKYPVGSAGVGFNIR